MGFLHHKSVDKIIPNAQSAYDGDKQARGRALFETLRETYPLQSDNVEVVAICAELLRADFNLLQDRIGGPQYIDACLTVSSFGPIQVHTILTLITAIPRRDVDRIEWR